MSARETVERLWDDAGKDHSYTVDIAHMEKFARAIALHLAEMCEGMIVTSHDSCARMGGIEDCAELLKTFAGELT